MSDLLKTARLVNGDDQFRWRVEAACWQEGVTYTPEVLKTVAADPAVVAQAVLEDPDTISSAAIDDKAITDAVAAYTAEM